MWTLFLFLESMWSYPNKEYIIKSVCFTLGVGGIQNFEPKMISDQNDPNVCIPDSSRGWVICAFMFAFGNFMVFRFSHNAWMRPTGSKVQIRVLCVCVWGGGVCVCVCVCVQGGVFCFCLFSFLFLFFYFFIALPLVSIRSSVTSPWFGKSTICHWISCCSYLKFNKHWYKDILTEDDQCCSSIRRGWSDDLVVMSTAQTAIADILLYLLF